MSDMFYCEVEIPSLRSRKLNLTSPVECSINYYSVTLIVTLNSFKTSLNHFLRSQQGI